MVNANVMDHQNDLESAINEYALVNKAPKIKTFKSYFKTQVLTENDVPSLRDLEIEKWGVNGFTIEMLQSIIKLAPNYSWGYFDHSKNKILGSCFVMGKSKESIINAKDWFETTNNGFGTSHDKNSKIWFGMSLSSSDDEAVLSIMIQVISKVLKDGIKEVYLGAPIPGFHKWSLKNPHLSVHDYIKLFRTYNNKKKHIDPLLAYYMHYGFEIVCVKENYFPYESAHNYGVLIKYKNPFWFLSPLIKLIPNKIFMYILTKVSAYY